MSDTPRTQAAIKTYGDYIRSEDAVSIEFAEQLERELAEARAEIERLKDKNTTSISAHMWAIMRHAFIDGAHKGYTHGTEYKLLTQMFAEWCSKNYPDAADNEVKRLTEIERKDKLIEQMRDALLALRKYPNTYRETGQGCRVVDVDINKCDAALSAAERGEG